MSYRLARQFAWILALIPVFGCGKDLRDVIAEYKGKVEPQVAKLSAIRAAAKEAPRITTDGAIIQGPPPKVAFLNIDEHVNVAIEYQEDLDDVTAYGNVPHRILASGTMNRCAALLANRRQPYDPTTGTVPLQVSWYEADDILKHCAAVRYVFVVRSLGYSAPSKIRSVAGPCPKPFSGDVSDAGVPPASADAGIAIVGSYAGKPCEVFDGGYLDAEVLVFDMNDSKQVGGFRFTAESSSSVDVGGSSNHSEKLDVDFATRIRAALVSGAEKWVPSFSQGS